METSPRPKYQMVAELLADRVSSMQANDALPTERDLMRELGVSRVTVRRALRVLGERGLVYQVQGSGTYVSHPDVVTKTLRLTSFTEDMESRGLTPASTTLSTERIAASAELANRLDLSVGDHVVEIRRLRIADGAPMALETLHVPVSLLDWDELDLDGSLYAAMEAKGVRIERAAQTVEAVNLDPDQAHLLQLAVGAAALRVTRVSRTDRGQAVESGETIYRGDRYGFDIVVTRDAL